MKRSIRLLLIAVSIALLAASLSVSVSAADEVIASGDEGTIHWAYTSNPDAPGTYILTISGSGDMPNASGATKVVWRACGSYYTNTTKVVIEDGVTSIGKYAFNQFKKLEEIVIPSSVTQIYNQGLTGTNLKNLVIPETVTTVNAEAFSSNTFDSIAIPSTLNPGTATSIFKNCNIGNVTIYSANASTDITSKLYNNILNANVDSVDTVTILAANGSVTYDKVGFASLTAGTSVGITKTEAGGKTAYGISAATPANTTVSVAYKSGLKASEFAVVGVDGAIYDSASGMISLGAAAASYEVITLPKITNCALRLNQDINMVYTVNVPACFDSSEFSISFMGETYVLDGDDHATEYVFEKIMPQYMSEALTASLSATYGGKTYNAAGCTMNVREYCAYLIEKNPTDTELVTLVSDILVYGAKAQLYANHNVNDLATDGVAIKPSAGFIPESKIAYSGEAYDGAKVTGAGVICADGFKTYVKFTATDTQDLYFVATINGREYRFDVSALSGNGNYNVIIDGIKAHELDDAISFTFEKDGEQVGVTTVFTVNSYAAYMLENAEEGALRDLIGAIANYGNSAKNYYNKIGG